MAFVPGYKYDIFISYAHVDNQTALLNREGWVDQFQRHLQVRLAKEFGRFDLIDVWRDDKLERGQLFDKTIQQVINNSAILVSLTSNGHLASTYCQNELAWFEDKASREPEGVVIGDRPRLINCLINDLNYTQWPEVLSGTSGYSFFDADEDGDPTEPSCRLFQKQLRELVKYIFRLLNDFKELKTQTHITINKNEDENSHKHADIFIADVSDSLRATRKRVIEDLSNKGLEIISDMPPPYELEKHDHKVREALRNSSMSVHLFDQYAGREILKQDEETYPQRQLEISKDFKKTSLIWIPKNLDSSIVESHRHQTFLDKLENGDRKEFTYEFIRGNSTDLSSEIIDKLEQVKFENEISNISNAVLLDTHLKDQSYAWELGKYFLKKNIQPFINPQKDDPNENLSILESRLSEVSVLMILYGRVNSEWVRQRLAAALQLSVIKALNLQAFCVVNVPPQKSVDTLDFNFGPIPVQMIDYGSGNLDQSKFDQILHSFQNTGSA